MRFDFAHQNKLLLCARLNKALQIPRCPQYHATLCRRKKENPPRVEGHHLLSPERAALGESRLTTGGLAENGRASLADDNGLGVGENSGDGEAAGALDVHEERPGSGHKGLSICQYTIPPNFTRHFWKGALRTLSLCLRASETGLGLRRSTARTLKDKSVSITVCIEIYILS